MISENWAVVCFKVNRSSDSCSPEPSDKRKKGTEILSRNPRIKAAVAVSLNQHTPIRLRCSFWLPFQTRDQQEGMCVLFPFFSSGFPVKKKNRKGGNRVIAPKNPPGANGSFRPASLKHSVQKSASPRLASATRPVPRSTACGGGFVGSAENEKEKSSGGIPNSTQVGQGTRDPQAKERKASRIRCFWPESLVGTEVIKGHGSPSLLRCSN